MTTVRPSLSPDMIAQRIEVRNIRQQVLPCPDPPFTAILDEAVLHRVVGGPTVMRKRPLTVPLLSWRSWPSVAGVIHVDAWWARYTWSATQTSNAAAQHRLNCMLCC
jgi:hypothetical protein